MLGSKGSFNPDIPIDEQPECIAYQDKWEFPREKLEFGKQEGGALKTILTCSMFRLLNGMILFWKYA